MDRITLAQLRALEALADTGSLAGAAERLGRTHPAVQAAVRSLEAQLGLPLFVRGGYRLALTDAGRLILGKARGVLAGARELEVHAGRLAAGEEPEFKVVIGDLTPVPETINLLQREMAAFPATRLRLAFETLAGPWERLLDGEADLIFHHLEPGEMRFEAIPLRTVRLIPVSAPGLFPADPQELRPEHLQRAPQCIVRDTATLWKGRDYFLVPGAPSVSVGDQLTKREVILQGVGWGHMPDFLIKDDLATGRLVSLQGPVLRGGAAEIVAARRAAATHGPVATMVWAGLATQ